MSPATRLELQRLLSALCDGAMAEAQHARLEQLLHIDPECRQLYLEYVDMHARLLVHPQLSFDLDTDHWPVLASGAPSPSTPAMDGSPAAVVNIEPVARIKSNRRQVRQVLRYVLVATATLAASLLVQVVWWHPSAAETSGPALPSIATPPARIQGYVATLTHTAQCVWDNPGEPWRVGTRLLPGELQLRRGVAQIRFDSGSELVVEGPAHLRIDSSTTATVLRGQIVFKADENDAPFTLFTPSAALVDLGTEYAVAVGPEGEEIHVFDGEVERTPKSTPGRAEAELLTAGEARRYGTVSTSPGQPTPIDPKRFVRQLVGAGLDPAAGLLAYEGFDYADRRLLQAGKANTGTGWTGPWRPGFARPTNDGDRNRVALNVKESLSRPGAAVPSIGGSFDYTGFAKYFRPLATPVRLDADGVYYLSFLFRRHGPPDDPLNAVAVLLRTTEELECELQRKGIDLRKRLNVGVDRSNHLFTHLNRIGTRTPLPLSYGETYLLVAKIAASGTNSDQVFVRVYGPEEPVDPEEPGSWSVVGPQVQSDLVFDWLEVHINSKKRQTIDEIRLGTTWSSVTAAWMTRPGAHREFKP